VVDIGQMMAFVKPVPVGMIKKDRNWANLHSRGRGTKCVSSVAMKTQSRFHVYNVLLLCSVYVVLAGVIVPFGAETICHTDTPETESIPGWHPYDQRQEPTRMVPVAPQQTAEGLSIAVLLLQDVEDVNRSQFLAVHTNHTPFTAHYLYPPFRPRDPSLS